MIRILRHIRPLLSRLKRAEDGLATMEAAMLFPVLVCLVFGIYDIGHGIILNQKVVASAHIAADLLARKPVVSETDIEDAVEAARLSIDPYDRDAFGIDIVSIEFGRRDAPGTVWRRTYGMAASPALPAAADGLGYEGEGVLAVTTYYKYEPYFYRMIFSNITMKEVSYLRGRKSSIIRHEDMI